MEQVGVDFGTATTLVARGTGPGASMVVPLGLSTPWLPSVARPDGADVVVGEDATPRHGRRRRRRRRRG
jgi:molecular chaperone DnaK (HSP70)